MGTLVATYQNTLNILHITPYYAPAWSYGGVVSAVTGLATAQAKLGHHVMVLTTDALTATTRHTVYREVLDGVEVIRLRNLSNTLHTRFNLSIPLGFRTAIRDLGQIDVIHAHEVRTIANLWIPPEYPIIVSPHGTLPYGTGRSIVKRTWDRLFGQRLLRKINHIAALTAVEADEAEHLWDSMRIAFPGATVIPNGIAAGFSASGDLRPRFNLGAGPVILFLGRLHERKGVQYLIPAFAEIASEFPNTRLLIVGPDAGMLDQLRELVMKANLEDRVIFTGMLTGDDLHAALATADLFVLPAVGEGLSMSALEAMGAGLPLIVTPGCNLPDLEARGAGLIVDREIAPLEEALRTLIADPARRKAMGVCGQKWVESAFTWDKIAVQTEKLYTHLIQK